MSNLHQNPSPVSLRNTGTRSNLSRSTQRAGSITVYGAEKREFFSFNLIAFALAGFFLFKVSLLSFYGSEGYAERLTIFQSGTVIEKLCARLLDIDPITAALSMLVSVFV